MADEYYHIPAEPQYRELIRKLQNSDPASADGTFNPLIENTAAVKKQTDAAQQTLVEATVPSRTVTVAAGNLYEYVNALPRLLTEALTIQVPAGEADSTLCVNNFYGSGSLTIAANGTDVVIPAVQINDSKVLVTFNNIIFNSTTAGALVSIDNSAHVVLSECKISPNQHVGPNKSGCAVNGLSHAYLNKCNVKNVTYGVTSWSGSIATLSACTGENLTYGLYCHGGIFFLLAGTSDTLNAPENIIHAGSGGCIISSDGSVISTT